MAVTKPIIFQLNSPKKVRNVLAKLFRMRYAGSIEGDVIRDLIADARVMLEYDKHDRDIKLDERIATLENYIRGDGTGTVIDAKELNSPLITDLKKKLSAAEKTNNELNNDLLSIKQKANELEAEMELLRDGQAEA